jgi:stress-induced-phosphoprotein 1
MKDFDKCIDACNDAIEQASKGSYDYVKLGKAMSRKANALLQKGMFDESIEVYNKALLENNDHGIKMGLQKAQKIKKEREAKAYIDPAKAEEHKAAGSELYKKGEYPAALKEFDEGVRRNPDNVALYSNRSATLIKLMDITAALKDADKCISLDPNFVKAYARKGTCHHLLKEYHKAMKAFEDGLKIDPQNKECVEGKNKTMTTIQMTAGVTSGNDEERLRHAMADPEIQNIMRDPTIRQVLKDLSENPQAAMGQLKDPYIADCINKLVAAGVVKMG